MVNETTPDNPDPRSVLPRGEEKAQEAIFGSPTLENHVGFTYFEDISLLKQYGGSRISVGGEGTAVVTPPGAFLQYQWNLRRKEEVKEE